jgi:hypothetical protein
MRNSKKLIMVTIARVSSKQTNKIFGSNRNKPKLNLFRFIFGLFRETKNYFFRFVSVRFGVSDPFRNKPKKRKNTKETENLVIKRAEKSCLKRSTGTVLSN